MALQTGQIIDAKYRVIRELGSGSMGAVYEGENVLIKRRVAIKVLLPAVAERGDVVKRFEREAQAAGRIGSDHIVEVLDLGSLPDGGFYMVMEYLEGETLGARIKRRGRMDGRAIAPIVQQLLMGLEMAHDASVIHRDLKPENVFLCREHAGQKDFVKILDFGVSKFNPLNDDEGMSMTRTGTVVGTPFYMAPEQAKGARDIDARSDLYAVGVILYEAITGQVPFHAGTFNELIFKIVLETPPPPEQFAPDLDPAMARLIRKAMGREPDDRFQTAAEFRDALYVWLHTGRDDDGEVPIRPPPVGSDIDWAEEKKTLLMDPDDPSNMTTRVIDDGNELGPGGTAIVDPLEASTRIVDPDTESNAKTRTDVRAQPPTSPPKSARAKRPPPPPRKRPPPPPASAPASSSAPPAAKPAPPPPAPTAGGLGYGAPTPVNRRPPASEDWPTGVPRKRSPVVPIIVGVTIAVATAGAAAAFIVPTFTSAPTTATEPSEDDVEEEAAPNDEPSTPDERPVLAKGEEVTAGNDVAKGGDDDVGDPADEPPTSEPDPHPPTTPPPTPRAAPPAPPRPAPPRPPPPPPAKPDPPPKPKPPGRKVETTL